MGLVTAHSKPLCFILVVTEKTICLSICLILCTIYCLGHQVNRHPPTHHFGNMSSCAKGLGGAQSPSVRASRKFYSILTTSYLIIQNESITVNLIRFYLIPYHKTAYKEFWCQTSMKHALINQLTKLTNKLKLQFTVVLFMTHM